MRTAFLLIFIFIFSLSFNSCVTTVRATPAKVVVVKKLPRTHKVVYVKGQRYYTCKGKHYKKINNGYVLVKI